MAENNDIPKHDRFDIHKCGTFRFRTTALTNPEKTHLLLEMPNIKMIHCFF